MSQIFDKKLTKELRKLAAELEELITGSCGSLPPILKTAWECVVDHRVSLIHHACDCTRCREGK